MLGEDVAHENVAVVRSRFRLRECSESYQFRNLRLVRISHHPLDARHPRQFPRGALRVAARDQNARPRVLAMYPANGLTHVVVGRGGDRAGVQHHQVGGGALTGRVESLGCQQRFQSRAVRLRSPASEILYEVFPHLFRL